MLTTEQINRLAEILLEAGEDANRADNDLDYGERRAEDAKDYADTAISEAEEARDSAETARDYADEALEEIECARENIRSVKNQLEDAQEILKEAKETKDDLAKTIEVLGTIKDLLNDLPIEVFKRTLDAQDRAFERRTGIKLSQPTKEEPENTEEVSDLTSDDLQDLESEESEVC